MMKATKATSVSKAPLDKEEERTTTETMRIITSYKDSISQMTKKPPTQRSLLLNARESEPYPKIAWEKKLLKVWWSEETYYVLRTHTLVPYQMKDEVYSLTFAWMEQGEKGEDSVAN